MLIGIYSGYTLNYDIVDHKISSDVLCFCYYHKFSLLQIYFQAVIITPAIKTLYEMLYFLQLSC